MSSGGGDEYRCITLQTNLKEDRWVTAADFHPGDGAAVHCASFGIFRKNGGNSVDCGANRIVAANDLGTWIPDQAVTRLPKNVARLLPAGARIVMRIHYHKTGRAVSARSSLGLYFARGQAVKPRQTVILAAP